MHTEIDSWGNSHPSLKVHIKYFLGYPKLEKFGARVYISFCYRNEGKHYPLESRK